MRMASRRFLAEGGDEEMGVSTKRDGSTVLSYINLFKS
jgi:hypothetical protein